MRRGFLQPILSRRSELDVRYQFESISFVAEYGGAALVEGSIISIQPKLRFKFYITPRDDGEWTLRRFDWSRDDSPALSSSRELQQELVNRAARLLQPVNAWPTEQIDGGAAISMNSGLAPVSEVPISFRPELLQLPPYAWEKLWTLINGRVMHDRAFRVLGFEQSEVCQAVQRIKRVFPADWVKAQYKAAISSGNVFMAADEPGEFPAYHLARTALGAICIDPGWNYLVEIGMSLGELAAFKEVGQLEKQVCKSPGVRHHLCFAAELFKRNLLIGLEPLIGSGGARNDLLVRVNEREYEIEIKELTSKDPIKRLRREIDQKVSSLPRVPKRHMVFYVVLAERAVYDRDKEKSFFDEVAQLQENLHPSISAIIAGKCFLDSSGGRIKRGIERCIINTSAYLPPSQDDLAVIFQSNYSSIRYPIVGPERFRFNLTARKTPD